MLKIISVISAFLIFAFGILFTSVFRTAAVKYEFSSPAKISSVLSSDTDEININYNLAYPGKILPDNFFWPLKAFRDRVWLWVTTNPSRKAELNLLFADKRLGASKILFERGKAEEGYIVLTKAEKYLETAQFLEKQNRIKGLDTYEFLLRIANASLKHGEVINEVLKVAPDDAKPNIQVLERYPKKVFEEARNALLEKGNVPPECPFPWY